ncbi:MAG: UDP-galactopyranose mutase [Bacteroidales bacterium]|nr:UDP-galactopyranose mutase [Bacteroidales bacterium]
MLENVDAVIVGAGLAGLVTAERLASRGKSVLIVEKKKHIGGHCYDYLNESGIYVHQYGPHIFHTDNEKVWDYLSGFTEWNFYEHKVIAMIDGQAVPLPFNLNSMEKLFSPYLYEKLEKKLIMAYGYNSRVTIMELRKAEDPDLQYLANFIYEKVFLNYTMKQWGDVKPEDIDESVSGRVPVVVSRDDRYFHNKHQGIPMHGYTAMFNKMIDSPNIHLLLNTDVKHLLRFRDEKIFLSDREFNGELIYTGIIDELFNEEFGELPYRSVDILFQEHNQQYFQEKAVVNYPNNYNLTRITEYKHFQKNHKDLPHRTTISQELPIPYVKGVNNPYYVVKTEENLERHRQYMKMADKIDNLTILGRLAEYKYYDMDQIVAAALENSKLLCRDEIKEKQVKN